MADTRAKSAVKNYRLSIRGNTPDMGTPGVLFCGCDDGYYRKFASSFLLSAEKLAEPLHIHIHLYGPCQETLDHIDRMRRSLDHVRLSFTWEDESYRRLSLPGPVYFSAARFLVLHHLLLACKAPILCVDIDGIVRRPLDEVFRMIERADVTLHFRLGERRVWRRVMAGAVGVSHSKAALGFCEKLANAIWRALHMRPTDHVDQPVIYYLYVIRRRLKRRIRWQHMPAGVVDVAFGDDSFIWSAKGALKEGVVFSRATSALEATYALNLDQSHAIYAEARGDGTNG
ncbi:hypothetical protein P409_01365 [Inquilinus limosus MP06]|uniref:Glycosyl transferase n=1 Tax=Inquilinus limosus MP06 TaxID=1398085 RepID=A0A0A0DB99_9PROT|nr:hypothetical protein P409_01365 [Inquilinus limosus MP06]